jgi:hypothetical protein
MDQIFENEDGETDFGNVLIKIEYYCQSFIFLLKDDVFVFSALFYLLFAVSGYFYEMMYAF